MPEQTWTQTTPILSAQQYAAIHLRVPDSGVPWLDEMIERSRRDAFAGQALAAYGTMDLQSKTQAECAYDDADAMLAAEKGGQS